VGRPALARDVPSGRAPRRRPQNRGVGGAEGLTVLFECLFRGLPYVPGDRRLENKLGEVQASGSGGDRMVAGELNQPAE